MDPDVVAPGAGDAGSVLGATADQVDQALGYVPNLARRYVGCGIPFDELLSAGNLGLVEAALRFDPGRGVKFITYADWWIRKAILETLEEQTGPMRLPRYQHERLRALRKARTELRSSRRREPSADDLAQATGVPVVEAELLLRHQSSAVSLEQPATAGDDRPLKELLTDAEHDNPQRSLVRRDLADRVLRHLARLQRRERDVICLRFGFGVDRPMTLREVGRAMGISRERVRQVELRALLQLRQRI